MFLVNCIVTFLERTNPASNMAKPAAIQKTRKPPIKNSSEFKMKTLSVGTATATSCAKAPLVVAIRPNAANEILLHNFFMFLFLLNRVCTGFTRTHTNCLFHVEDKDFSIPNFSSACCVSDCFDNIFRLRRFDD